MHTHPSVPPLWKGTNNAGAAKATLPSLHCRTLVLNSARQKAATLAVSQSRKGEREKEKPGKVFSASCGRGNEKFARFRLPAFTRAPSAGQDVPPAGGVGARAEGGALRSADTCLAASPLDSSAPHINVHRPFSQGNVGAGAPAWLPGRNKGGMKQKDPSLPRSLYRTRRPVLMCYFLKKCF